jgi:hypothetical protein
MEIYEVPRKFLYLLWINENNQINEKSTPVTNKIFDVKVHYESEWRPSRPSQSGLCLYCRCTATWIIHGQTTEHRECNTLYRHSCWNNLTKQQTVTCMLCFRFYNPTDITKTILKYDLIWGYMPQEDKVSYIQHNVLFEEKRTKDMIPLLYNFEILLTRILLLCEPKR